MANKPIFDPIFKGNHSQRNDTDPISLPSAPPWRRFSTDSKGRQLRDVARGKSYLASPKEIEIVNAALYLRRPILISGPPGIGKSSLAYAVAYELNLGPVLRWSITSRSTLRDGLYSYDAVARLQDANLATYQKRSPLTIGEFIRLGPLGTAFYDSGRQDSPRMRMLLVDEIDKSDLDLPNDLLHVLEEGEFLINEILRDTHISKGAGKKNGQVPDFDMQWADVSRWDTDDATELARIRADGRVRCESNHFPLVIFTSNGEREFPPAFLRRCLRLKLEHPDKERLEQIVDGHFNQEIDTALIEQRRKLIDQFLSRLEKGESLATDQLLNAIYMVMEESRTAGNKQERLESLIKELFTALS